MLNKSKIVMCPSEINPVLQLKSNLARKLDTYFRTEMHQKNHFKNLFLLRHYLLGYFIIDLLSSFPVLIITGWDNSTTKVVFLYLKLLKIFRLPPLLTIIRNTGLRRWGLWSYQVEIFVMVLIMLLLIIWATEISYMVHLRPEHRSDDRHYLLSVSDAAALLFLATTPLATEYLTIFFRTFCLMIGYFAKIFLFLGVFHIYNYHRNFVSRYKSYIRNAEQYAQYRGMPQDLTQDVIKYFDYVLRMNITTRDEIYRELQMMPVLYRDVMVHDLKRLVERVPIFKELPTVTINRIAISLKSEVYLPHSTIYEFGVVHNSMYFVNSGTIAIYDENETEICHLNDGDYFGVVGVLLKHEPQLEKVVTVTMCELLRLQHKEVARILKHFDSSDGSLTGIQDFVSDHANRKIKTRLV